MLPRTRPSDSFSATLVNNCRVQAKEEYISNIWRQYITKEKPFPHTEIDIDSKGTLYRYEGFQRINVDKEKRKKEKKHAL